MTKQKQMITEYKRIRNYIKNSMKYYKSIGADVDKYFKLPKVPKKITKSSINRIKYARQEWRYIIGKGPAPEGSAVSKAHFEEPIELKKALTEARIDDLHDDLKGTAEDQLQDWDFPDFVTMAVDKLWQVIYDALDVAGDRGSKGHSASQQAYYRRVYRHAEIAADKFVTIGADIDSNKEEYSRNIEHNWQEVQARLEHYIWFESDQPWTASNTKDLDYVLMALTTPAVDYRDVNFKKSFNGDDSEYTI